MLTFAATLALAAATAQPVQAVLGRIWPGKAAQQVGACGFRSVSLSYDRTLDEYSVVVSGASNASDEQLACAARASLGSDYSVQFPAPLNLRYEHIYWPLAEEAGREHARQWLARRGLLSKLPPYVKGRTDQLAYARKLERICGAKAKGAFVVQEGLVTMKAGTADHRQLDAATFECLSNALWASGLPTGLDGGQEP